MNIKHQDIREELILQLGYENAVKYVNSLNKRMNRTQKIKAGLIQPNKYDWAEYDKAAKKRAIKTWKKNKNKVESITNRHPLFR